MSKTHIRGMRSYIEQLPSAETILGKQPQPPPKILSLVVCDDANINDSDISDDDSLIQDSIPSIDVMPYFEYKDEYGMEITLHRQTTYMLIKSGTLKAYIFGRFSAVEKTTLDETGKEQRIAYIRGDMPDIEDEVLARFGFSLARFDGYPRGTPRDLDSPIEMKFYRNPVRMIKSRIESKLFRPRGGSTYRPVKSREIWNDAEEIVFKLLIEHHIPLEYLALFFQDKEKCIKERARWRGYMKDLRIMKNRKWSKNGR